MATFDYTNGDLAGLQMQAGAHGGVNAWELDFAEVYKAHPALAAGDKIVVAHIGKGFLCHGVSAETVSPSQAGASNLSLTDEAAAVILDTHDIATTGTITGPKEGAATLFGGGVATGLHNIFVTAQKDIVVVVGAVVPQKGVLRVSASLAHMANF